MTTITLSEIVDLAILGRKYIKQEADKNVICWLGNLPSESQLKSAGQAFKDIIYDNPDLSQYDPFVEVE